MPEDPPDGTPDVPAPSDGARITGAIVSHISDQARRTTEAAKARRVTNADGEPGVLDLTPLRQLLAELIDELGKLRLRTRIGRTLRQAADVIDPQTPDD